MGLLLLPALFGAMWFFTIRPQQQRLRSQRSLVASLAIGDEVLTAGGIIGIVARLDDAELELDLGGGTTIRLVRAAVTSRIGPDRGPDLGNA